MIDVALMEIDLSPEEEGAALNDPRFADVFLDGDALPSLTLGYLDSGFAPGIVWLTDVHTAVKANAVEIAQKLLRDDGEGALTSWNATDIRWPAKAISKMANGTWRISGVGGQKLTIYPDRLQEFLLDLQRFIVNAGKRGAALLQ